MDITKIVEASDETRVVFRMRNTAEVMDMVKFLGLPPPLKEDGYYVVDVLDNMSVVFFTNKPKKEKK